MPADRLSPRPTLPPRTTATETHTWYGRRMTWTTLETPSTGVARAGARSVLWAAVPEVAARSSPQALVVWVSRFRGGSVSGQHLRSALGRPQVPLAGAARQTARDD